MTIRLGIAGGAGRMGGAILLQLLHDSRFQVGPVRVRPGSVPHDPLPTGSYLVTTAQELFQDSDVVLDFTSPQLCKEHVMIAKESKVPLLIGTTGLGESHLHEIKMASDHAPILLSSNTSLGVAVLEVLVENALKLLKGYDIEIIEAHHRYKNDAPSGTARRLLEVIENSAHVPVEAISHLTQRRGEGDTLQVGLSSVRAGGILGDHIVLFGNEDETLTISHRCMDRRLYAKGALHGALWLRSQLPGLYRMSDSLSL